MRNVGWTLGSAPDGLDARRERGRRDARASSPSQIAELAPLDAQRILPLGYRGDGGADAMSDRPRSRSCTSRRGSTSAARTRARSTGSAGSTATRFAPSLVTTQPSANRRLGEVAPVRDRGLAAAGPDRRASTCRRCIFDFIATRGVDVLHIMNSRLGFELLPDLACAAVAARGRRAAARRGGGPLGLRPLRDDAATATSSTRSRSPPSTSREAVEGYDVPRSQHPRDPHGRRRRGRVLARPRAARRRARARRFNVLYPGRLAEQKDPLLMVEVAAELARRRPEAARPRGRRRPARAARARARGASAASAGRCASTRPRTGSAPWYAASDALLMTSVFEGVPYVVYEAMAMGLPIVAPALPGNAELLGAGDAGLVAAARRRERLRRAARRARRRRGRAPPGRREHRARAHGRAVRARDGGRPRARSTTTLLAAPPARRGGARSAALGARPAAAAPARRHAARLAS